MQPSQGCVDTHVLSCILAGVTLDVVLACAESAEFRPPVFAGAQQ